MHNLEDLHHKSRRHEGRHAGKFCSGTIRVLEEQAKLLARRKKVDFLEVSTDYWANIWV